MKTDSIFYSLFQSTPSIFFELIGKSPEAAQGYQFASVEVKQTALRMDGVLLPTTETAETPTYFLEVQFQPDPALYRRLLAEILLYLRQNPEVRYWQAIVVYPQPNVEVPEVGTLNQWLQPPVLRIIYLNQLGTIPQLPLGLAILRLIVEPVSSMPQVARGLVDRVQQTTLADADRNKFVELIETIVVYAFPRLSRQEIAAMLGVTDMRETRVFQDALEEGRREEARSLVLRQLSRKVGSLAEDLQVRVGQLPLEALEALGEALIDFSSTADLQTWLDQHDA